MLYFCIKPTAKSIEYWLCDAIIKLVLCDFCMTICFWCCCCCYCFFFVVVVGGDGGEGISFVVVVVIKKKI